MCFFKVLIRFCVLFGLSLLSANGWAQQTVAEAEDVEVNYEDWDWRTQMPVSMNGELPSEGRGWIAGTESTVWYESIWVTDAIRKTWKAEAFFTDDRTVELCNAIFEVDMATMKRLIIEEHVNVNDIGVDGMNPLYWALHMNEDPRPFKMLLEHGADPNVAVFYNPLEDDIDRPALPNCAVTNLVVNGRYNRQFKNVFQHGGDPNLKDFRYGALINRPAFFSLLPSAPDSVERLKLMIDCGADLSFRIGELGMTFQFMHAGLSEESNRLALTALDYGKASYQLYYRMNGPVMKPFWKGCYFRLIHGLAEAEPAYAQKPAEQKIHFNALVGWLEDHGESLAEAKADLERWKKWNEAGRLDLIEREHQVRLFNQRQKNTKRNGSEEKNSDDQNSDDQNSDEQNSDEQSSDEQNATGRVEKPRDIQSQKR